MTNAVIDPDTMMIKPIHTFALIMKLHIAYFAVPGLIMHDTFAYMTV